MKEKYNIVDTPEKLRQLDAILMNEDGTCKFQMLALDTETNGLKLHRSTVIGFSISSDSKSGYYIPLLKWVADPESAYERTYQKEKYDAFKTGKLQCVWTGEVFDEFVLPSEYNIKERFPAIPYLLNRWCGSTNLIFHNASFDVNMIYANMGVDLKNNIFVDTALLLHVLNENEPTALKKAAERYKEKLGINPHANAAIEKKELDSSIVRNGGKPGQVWRASLDFQGKYACADTFLTFGLYEVAISDFIAQFGDKGVNWFFKQEVMPVCREVVIDMKRNGIFVDVPYFQKLCDENATKLLKLEDEFVSYLENANLLSGFPLGKSVEETVSKQRFIKKIIELENLAVPKKLDKKTGIEKETLAKGEVKKAYQKNPHWVWGYIVGEDEIKYSEARIQEIKQNLYEEIEGRRYRFNLNSRNHLAWLLCDKLGIKKTSLPQTDSATKENPIPSLDADILKEHILPKFPWISTLLAFKKLAKLQSTYIKPALELNIDGWLYMDMKQNGTTSGRFSCSGGYNLQTLPRVDDEMEILEECDQCQSKNITILQDLECIANRKCNDCGFILNDIARPSSIKKGFIAPPGFKIVNADYSSLEPRCFAFQSGEEKLKEVYWKGLDLYSKVFCDMFDPENLYSADPSAPNFLKKVANAKRKWVKPIVLGIPYGAEEDQVASLIGAKIPKLKNGVPVVDDNGNIVMIPDRKEGNRVRTAYLTTYSKLHNYMNEQDFKAVTLGFVETLVGRRRHLPFSKKINDVLLDYGVDWEDLAQTVPYKLKEPTVSYVSKRGKQVTLTQDMLSRIQESIRIRDDKLASKGYWALIRSMLKADLNNAKNSPIQGLAGHITNIGMLDSNRGFKAKGLEAWVVVQVHDEITVYARADQSADASAVLKQGMEKNEFTALLDIDMIADPIICDNLKESK